MTVFGRIDDLYRTMVARMQPREAGKPKAGIPVKDVLESMKDQSVYGHYAVED